MRMSPRREQAIYEAVYDRFMDLRVQLQREHGLNADIDYKIARAMDQAGLAAIEAAKTGKHSRTWRGNKIDSADL